MAGVAASAYGLLIGLVLAATGLPLAPGALSMQAVVNSGHRGAVLDIAPDTAHGLLFSAGEDGTLRVWDTESRSLLRRIPITRRMVGSVALDPAASRVAVVIADEVRSYAIEVWDWDAVRLVARVPLDDPPLFVRFSQTGTYLLCGEAAWQGIRIFRVSDGSPVRFHPEGFGMVAFAETSRNDATLMTYRPAGRIDYWDLASGSLLQQHETRAGLSGIRISDDRRLLVGTDGDSVAAVDALTGEPRFEIQQPGLASMDASGDGTRIACLTRDGQLVGWTRGEGGLSSRAVALDPGIRPRLVRWAAGTIIVGGQEGALEAVDDVGRETGFARDALSAVTGLALGNGMLVLATVRSLHVFSRPPSGIAHFVVPNPYGGPVGLDFIGGGKLLVWREDDGPAAVGVIDLSSRSFTDSGIRFSAPIVAAAARDGRLVTLLGDGLVQVSDLATGALRFETRRPGVSSVAAVGPHTLLCGRTAGGAVGSSLMRIDTRTGETTPVSCPSRVTFSVMGDPDRRTAYSLGVDADGKTQLILHTGPGLDTGTVLRSAEGELLSASAALDATDGVLYAALDQEAVEAWSGSVRERGVLPIRGAVSLRAADDILVSLDKDSEVSLWDTATGRPLGEISLFADDQWAVTLPDGSYTGSPDVHKRVAVFLESRLREVPPQLTNPPARIQSKTQ
jgi:WD40 repeat protein